MDPVFGSFPTPGRDIPYWHQKVVALASKRPLVPTLKRSKKLSGTRWLGATKNGFHGLALASRFPRV